MLESPEAVDRPWQHAPRGRSGSTSSVDGSPDGFAATMASTSPALHQGNNNKPSTFLSKLLQKRYQQPYAKETLSSPPPPPAHRAPEPDTMLSTPLLSRDKKKPRGIGRFFKKLSKNSLKDQDEARTLAQRYDMEDDDDEAAGNVPMQPHSHAPMTRRMTPRAHEHASAAPMSPGSPPPVPIHHSLPPMNGAQAQASPPPMVPTGRAPHVVVPGSQDDFQLRYHSSSTPIHGMPILHAPLVPRSTSLDVRRSTVITPPSIMFAPVVIPPRTVSQERTRRALSKRSRKKNDKNEEKTELDEKDDDDNDDDDDDDSSSSDLDHDTVKRLSKRLSGGHFGSAGGLILSTMSLQNAQQSPEPPQLQPSHGHHHNHDAEEDDESPATTVTAPSTNSKASIASTTQSPSPSPSSSTSPPSTLSHTHPDDVVDAPMALDTVSATSASSNSLNSRENDETSIKSSASRTSVAALAPSNIDEHDRIPADAHTSPLGDEASENAKISIDIEHADKDTAPTSPSQKEISPEDYAQRLWQEDELVNTEHVAEWLGNGSSTSAHVLQIYMSFYEFAELQLEDALRLLCSKLSLKAESQQIDRILEEFSKRYFDCHPLSIFGNSDVIHAIVYSLILLNTDLHIAQGERKKMTRGAFVRNTMDAILAQLEDTMSMTTTASSAYVNPLLDEGKFTSCISLQSDTQEHDTLKRATSLSYAHRAPPSQPLRLAPQTRQQHQRTEGSASFDLTRHPLGSRAWQQDMEQLLKQMYLSIRHHQIMLPGTKMDQRSAYKRGVGNRFWKATRDSLFVSDSASELPPPTPRSTMSSVSGAFSRRRSISSMRSGYSHHSQHTQGTSTMAGLGASNYQAVASLLHHADDLPTAFTSAAPYYKEGMIARKHLLEEANRRARSRDWKDCFMVVDRGQLRMYRLDMQQPQRRKERTGMAALARHPLQGMISRSNQLSTAFESQISLDQTTASSMTSEVIVGAGDWVANAQLVGDIDLKHTLSNALPSGYSRQRPHAFALQQANGGVYLFHVGSAEQVFEWVSTCNYWAARESKEPLMGGVGSLEYGWGRDMDGDQQENALSPNMHVYEWIPPVPPLVPSTLGETQQLDALQMHIKTLNDELDKHRELKHRVERFPKKNPHRVCAKANFENKNQYLLHEIIKYQNYCDALEQSLSLQDKALDDEKKKEQELAT
ncbi:hypothetical protein BC940DRAFT_299881 [Gongronella butleri]|nr:hypothetical protein BC940DRAFT_299881 [Gongronella butleri]